MNTATIILNIVLVILVFTVPRKYLLLPFIAAACFAPMNQRVIILGLDFTVVRIVVLFGMIRMLSFNEVRNIQWNHFDKLILAWNIAGTIIYVMQWRSFSAVI